MRAVPALLLAAVLLLAGCSGVSPERKKEAAARMQMGVTYLQQQDLPSAMRELTRASELDPENPEIDMMLGLAYQKRGDLGKAEEYLRVAIGKDPDYAEAHNNLGNLMSLLGRGEEAIREYEKAAANVLYPTPEYAYYNMGREYFRRKELGLAEEKYARAVSLNPSFLEAYRGLAMVQGMRGEWDKAVHTLKRGVGVAPAYAPAWMDLGNAYLKLGRQQEAAGAFRSVLEHSRDAEMRSQATNFLNLLEPGRR